MKTLIVYASWFGHNRAVARAIALELARCGVSVSCRPASRVTKDDIAGYDLLVLGTYTHAGRASRRLHALCEAIPHRLFGRLEVAIFGTQSPQELGDRRPSGVSELTTALAERGVDLALEPLTIGLRRPAAFLPWRGIGAAERRQIKEYVADLWEASVPEPIL